MKKLSKEIYKQIQVEKTIKSLGTDREDFEQCIKDLMNTTPNDYKAYKKLVEYIDIYPLLEEHIVEIFNSTAIEILKKLNITEDQFKEKLEEIERIKI